MAYAACDAIVLGSKQAPPGPISLQSIPCPQAKSRFACNLASGIPSLGTHHIGELLVLFGGDFGLCWKKFKLEKLTNS